MFHEDTAGEGIVRQLFSKIKEKTESSPQNGKKRPLRQITGDAHSAWKLRDLDSPAVMRTCGGLQGKPHLPRGMQSISRSRVFEACMRERLFTAELSISKSGNDTPGSQVSIAGIDPAFARLSRSRKPAVWPYGPKPKWHRCGQPGDSRSEPSPEPFAACSPQVVANTGSTAADLRVAFVGCGPARSGGRRRDAGSRLSGAS